MSICNDTRTLATAAVCGAALSSTACFDVHRVEVTGAAPLWLDDFEDGDEVSSAPEFQSWDCYPWQSGATRPTCAVTAEGLNGGRAQAFSFELGAPLDGEPDTSVGVGLGLFPTLPVDLSPWSGLRFDAKFQPALEATTDGTTLWVRLKCASVATGSPPLVESPVHVGANWSGFSLPWTSFRQPEYQTIALHVPDCIAHVSRLLFEIQLVDERTEAREGLSGTLTLDNVLLE